MRFTIALIALIAFFSNATALNCFLCLGSTTGDCARGDVNGMAVQNCEANLPAVQNTTLFKLGLSKVQFDVEEPPIVTTCVSFATTLGESKIVERGCGFIWEGVDICWYMSEIAEILACTSCDENLCNILPINVE